MTQYLPEREPDFILKVWAAPNGRGIAVLIDSELEDVDNAKLLRYIADQEETKHTHGIRIDPGSLN